GPPPPDMEGVPQRANPVAFQQDRRVGMLAHDRHSVIRYDEKCRELGRLADPSDKCTERTIDEPIALENRRMPRVLEMRDPVDAREDNQEEAPRFARGVEPGARDCPVQRRIRDRKSTRLNSSHVAI